jgi:hypothetical protein
LSRARDRAENATRITSWDSTSKGVGGRIATWRSPQKDCVPVPARAVGSLRIVRDVKVRVIEEVKEFHPKFETCPFPDLRVLDD